MVRDLSQAKKRITFYESNALDSIKDALTRLNDNQNAYPLIDNILSW